MDKITLSYGSGGTLTHRLIDSLFMKEFNNPILKEKKDSAIINIAGKLLAFTTDSYVVDPIFFPGGDIGSLAVYGTANDLAVCGARPLYISLGLVIEEGMDAGTLKRIVSSIKVAARRAGVKIVTGDTKVVEKGSCDKIFISTSGIGGIYRPGLSIDKIKAGDAVIVSGPVGDHAISVLSKREGVEFKTSVKSDSAPLYGLIRRMLAVSNKVRFMRDPTRGGLATTLNEMVFERNFGIALDEGSVPVRSGVRHACELLGFDPLYLACEGRVAAVVAEEDAGKMLAAMRRDKAALSASIIGHVAGEYKGRVYSRTSAGGKRIIDMLSGEQLPRIC